MLCLDTYALVEIGKGNPKFSVLLGKDFVITDLTMAEFYSLFYKENDERKAKYWYNKLSGYCRSVNIEILIKALKYRVDHKKENLSIFDCIGYIFSIENNLRFVTGDKAFEYKEGVEFIK